MIHQLTTVVCACLFCSGVQRPHVQPDLPQTRKLMAFVQRAASEVQIHGSKAFPAFRRRDGEWYRGDDYVFVLDSKGREVCNAGHPEYEGVLVSQRKDDHGRPFGAHMLAALMGHPTAWVYYRHQRPGDGAKIWKATYLMKTSAPDGHAYTVGSGAYEPRIDRLFVVDAVERACELLKSRGAAALAELRDKQGRFTFMDEYVFVLDESGRMLAHGAQPELEAKNQIDLQDANGKPIVRDFIRVATRAESGWVEYVWPKPGTRHSSRKRTYVKRASLHARTVVIGCGLYPE